MGLFDWLFKKKANPKSFNGNRVALCVGIIDYPDTKNDLRGCINDAMGWKELFEKTYGFNRVELLTNAQATVANVKKALQKLVKDSYSGDIIAFTYSGHGSFAPDNNGDEADKRDEALCCYDGLLIDDELQRIFASLKRGVSLNVIMDCCHSGTMTRSMWLNSLETEVDPRDVDRVKYMPPPIELFANPIETYTTSKQFLKESDMTDILLTGCKSNEVSFDTYIEGKFTGALTYVALKYIKSDPDQTWEQLHKKILKKLPSDQFRQTPQLEGTSENKRKRLFT